MKSSTKLETVDFGSGIKVELPVFSKMTDEELASEISKALNAFDAEYAFALFQEGIAREEARRGL